MDSVVDHEIDPDGNMILTLTNPNAPFAVWHDDDIVHPPASIPSIFTTPGRVSPLATVRVANSNTINHLASLHDKLENDEEDISAKTITYRVSSRHLSLASGRSRKMRHQWEQHKGPDGYFHISVEDWDSDALLTILNIIHLRHKQVPRSVSLEMLSKLAVIVDYFEFHEAVEVFSKLWMDDLQHAVPNAYDRDLILWTWAYHVFNMEQALKSVLFLSTAVQHCMGPMQDLGLPIPEHITNNRRTIAAIQIVDGVRELREGLLNDTEGCSYGCRCRILGALLKGLNRFHNFDSASEPLLGYSLAEVIRSIRKIPNPNSGKHYACRCSVTGLTASFLRQVERDMEELK
ncbi:hypothetical protein GGR53DRAFT_8209 [Hypoxylon sp. FL1150]|nr:hypothetical protein GGR53DRAFT_8209 [Hypoxylon sp. FL1150]